MKGLISRRASTAVTIGLLGLAVTSANALAKEMVVVKSPEQIKWFRTPVGAAAPLWGNMKKTAYGRLSKWNPGAKSPVHTHSRAYHSVILSGTFENVIVATGNVQKHTAGSYYYMPANVKHATRCVGAVPCVMYLHQKGPWDLKFPKK